MGKDIKESIMKEFADLKTTKQNEEAIKSYAHVTATNANDSIKKIIVKARNEEIAEDHDKKRRETNIIIHGVPEPSSKDN